VHAVRLPPEAAEAARRRCQTTARRKGRTPREDTLFLSGWMMVFTTVPAATLEGATVLELNRCRWQIELTFKRLKS
jgi:IS4 transposase